MTAVNPYNKRAYAALVFGLVAIGFSAIFVSWAAAPGAVVGFYRMAIAAAALTPLYVRRQQRNGRFHPRAMLIAAVAGFFFAADLIFWNTGILISGPTNPTLMGNTAPVWVGLGAMVFFRQKLPRTFWLGVLVALAGAAIILGLDVIRDVGLGTFFGLLAGVFYGAYFLVIQKTRRQLDTVSTLWMVAVSASAWLLLGTAVLRQPLTGYPPQTYWSLLALGLVVQVAGQLAITYSLGYLPASIVSPTLLGQPVLTAVLAIPLLGDTISFWQAVGGFTVIGGILLVHRSQQKNPTNQAATQAKVGSSPK